MMVNFELGDEMWKAWVTDDISIVFDNVAFAPHDTVCRTNNEMLT